MLTTKLKYEIVFTISQLLTFSMFVFLLCVVFKTGTLGVNENVFINDLLLNWEKKGIKQIYATNGNCAGLDSEFFSRKWEGTDWACNCRSSFYYGVKSDVYPGKCSFMQTMVGCKEIPPLEGKDLTNWKGSRLCVKKHEYDFYDSITIPGNKCPRKYTLCGTDTKNFNICFPKKHGCPINKIKVTNSHLINTEKKFFIFQTIKLNDDWFMHYSNNFFNDTMVIDVKYSEGRVCINPSEVNLKGYMKFKKIQNQTSSFNPNCLTKIGKFNFDERFKTFDSISKFKFYSDNNIMQQVEKLPHINSQDLISYNSYLYQRSYIHWSPYCRSDANLSPQSILNDLSKLSEIDIYYEVIKFYFLFIFFFFTMHICIGNFMTVTKQIDNLIDFFTFYFLLAFIPINILLIYILHSNSFMISKFSSQKCGDYTTNMTFNEIGKNLSELIISAYQIVLSVVILLAFLIIHKLIKK
jgi:hypothetical protein